MSINPSADDKEPVVEQEADFYDDLIIERYSLNVESDSGTQGTEDPENISWTVFDEGIADDLGRHQVAELVAYDHMMQVATVKQADGAGTTPGTIEWNDAWFLLEKGDQPFDAVDIENPIETSGSMSAGLAEFKKNPAPYGGRVLTDDFHYGQQPFNDTTNGSGGGGESINEGNNFTNLRKEFGRGPLAFPDWGLGNNSFIRFHEIDNEDVMLRSHLKCYWDVFELEERPSYRDIFEG